MKPNSYPLRAPQTIPFTRPSRPAVPMSVYRQVVEELQVTKAQLSAVKANNQQLQQEVEQLMQSAQRTQQLVNQSHRQLSGTKVSNVKPIWRAKSWDSAPQQQVVTVKYSPQRNSRQQKESAEINGWALAIAIILIILTAFTSGFLLVRPLLDNNN